MENKSDSRAKKIQKHDLKSSSENGSLFSGPHISSNSNKAIDQEQNISQSSFSLPDFSCNKSALKKLSLYEFKKELLFSDFQEKSEKLSYAFWKSLDRSSVIFINQNKTIKSSFLRKNTIDLLHSKLYSWHTLLQHIVSLPSLDNFNICQVLCHEKGTTNVNSYSFGTGSAIVESKTSIDSFNKVFSQIKKSKSNQFSQTHLTIPEFNFVGSFLASTHQLNTHNILFLLSENSFFPISDDSINEIELIIPQIKSVLELVIIKDSKDSKISNLLHLFEVLPSPISIHNMMGLPVYQNKAFKLAGPSDNSNNNVFESELNGGYKFLMHINSNFSKSDIQHFQRVGLLGELLNTLQHELSNPLFGIQLASQFLNQQDSDISIQESLGEISENCKRCQDIIRDFKFIYQGGDNFLNASLKKIIKETLTLTKSASRGIRKSLIFNDSLDEVIINTNPTWLSQIIFNLIINSSQAILNNSSDYSNKGQINILVSIVENGFIEIKVEDNGPGISRSSHSSIFNAFYTTKDKGTGLGLTICENLAEKLGGSIKHNNTANSGASFSLLLPINEINT